MTAQPLIERTNAAIHPINFSAWLTKPAREAVDHDAELQKAVRQTSFMRQVFYVVVLNVALAGQVTGAVEALGIPLIWAIPAVGALELGGIVVLANADVRRRLGERATASRVLSVLIAAFAVAFNWMAHSNKLLAGFFAGMSALGYLVWLMHTENQRRDRLRATGDLPPTTPAYELVGHWLAHPWLTRRARSLAKRDARLGLFGSLEAARLERIREVRSAAIARVVGEEIRRSADPNAARIALAVYDLNEVAVRLEAGADYDALTALVAARLHPNALVSGPQVRLDAPASDAPELCLSDAPEVRSVDTSQMQPAALGECASSAPSDASDGGASDTTDASGGDTTDASVRRITPRPALPIRRVPSGTGRTRQDPNVGRLLKHAAEAGRPPSIREAARLLNVGAPKAKELMKEAGLFPVNNERGE